MVIPSKHNTVNNNQKIAKWCKVVFSALIPCVLGVFTIIFTVQQQSFSRIQHALDQQNQLNAQRQTLFDAYINDISDLLLRTPNTNRTRDKNFFLYVRTKTLTALRNLNAERKKYILLFLYESGFLRNSDLDLSGADFNDIQLIGPYKIDGLYLPNVFWSNALFIRCNLIRAVFDQSHMPNARFINSTLERALFRETQLNDVYFKQTSVYNINFTGAFLVRANFLDADVVQSIDFTNTDLSYAQFTENQFQGKRINTSPNNFRHALLPNRSFGPIDSNQNLLKNGDAEMQCSTGGRREWRTIQILNGLSVVPLNDTAMINMMLDNWGNCTFRMTNKTARVSQFIELRHYSRLIEIDKAMLSSSAFFGCNGSTNAPYVEVSAHGSDGNLVENPLYLNRIEDTDVFMHPYSIKEYRLPKHTSQVRISFGVKSTLEPGIFCYFDNITLVIQEYQK